MGAVESMPSPSPSCTSIDTNDVKEEMNISVEPSVDVKEEITIPVQESVPSINIKEEMNIPFEESISSNDYCSYSIITPESDLNTNLSLNSNITDDNESTGYDIARTELPRTLEYGPIRVRVRQTVAPTLVTGRRSKFAQLEGEAAMKREIHRQRNRAAAKKMKENQIRIETKLKEEIIELECTERDLLTQIENLVTYKQYLEKQHEQTTAIKDRIMPARSLQMEFNRQRIYQNELIHHDHINIKRETRSPPPHWELRFSV